MRSALLIAAALVLAARGAPAQSLAPGDLVAVLAEESIVRIEPDGTIDPLFAADAAGFQTLYGIAALRGGRLLALALGGGAWLIRIDPSDASHAVVAALPAFGLPFSIAVDRNEDFAYLVDFSGDVLRVDLAGGGVANLVALPSSGVASFALAIARDGALYVSDDANDAVLRVDAGTGAAEVVAESVAIGGFYRAHGLDVDRDGTLLGTRFDPPAIVRIDPGTGASADVASGDLLDGPVEIEIDRDGTVFAANLWSGDVVRVDLATGAQTLLATPYLLTGLALVPWPECENGRDDDGDGAVDGPADPGCQLATSRSESPPCQDGVDNDGAIGVDFDGGAAANGGVPLDVPDPQCTSPWRGERGGCGLGVEIACALLALRTLQAGRVPAGGVRSGSLRHTHHE